MAKDTKKPKHIKVFIFSTAKVVVAFLLMLTLSGLILGCSKSITNTEKDESYLPTQSMIKEELFWFIELYNPFVSTDPDILKDYIDIQASSLDLYDLKGFVEEYIGDLTVYFERSEAEDYETSIFVQIKDTTVIKLPDGTTLTIIRYK